MSESPWRVQAGADSTIAVWDPPAGSLRAAFVCAHGAGGRMDDRSILAISNTLTTEGIGVVRFNFFYRAQGSARPDPMPRLLTCWRAVLARVREELDPQVLIVGGRSMGGRAASVLVSEDERADGLLLLAYPLHPAGHPEKIRAAHLGAIKVPVLCLNGTRDPLCDRPLMEQTLQGLGSNWRMHWIEGADHSFHVLKRSGRTDADVMQEVAAQVEAWLPPAPRHRS
jgi:predicted alpha/beta-hydrolase family hydrolase